MALVRSVQYDGKTIGTWINQVIQTGYQTTHTLPASQGCRSDSQRLDKFERSSREFVVQALSRVKRAHTVAHSVENAAAPTKLADGFSRRSIPGSVESASATNNYGGDDGT